MLIFNQVSAVSRVWEGSHGSVSRALSMDMGRDLDRAAKSSAMII